MNKSDQDDLLVSLYDGVRDSPTWDRFLTHLRRRLGADHARLHLYSGAGRCFSGISLVAEIQRAKVRQEALDPDLAAGLAENLRNNRIYTLEDIADIGEQLVTVLAADHGCADMRATRIGSDDLQGCLIVYRSAGEFSVSDSALMSELTQHLRIALRTFRDLKRTELRSLAAAEATAMRHQAWFLLAADGTIFDKDEAGARILDRASALYAGSDGRLHATRAHADQQLADIVRSFDFADPSERRIIRLSESPSLDLLLRPFTQFPGAMFDLVRLIAHVHEGHTSDVDCSRQLAAMLKLSPREAQLAQAIARGSGLPDAARALGLSLATARDYSKTIYAKTGAHSQVALTRLVQKALVMME